ncbi:copper resistance protein B [Phenylobacterium koreense]|uniref:Copper resistance protein B n=1 Tax=Phenylobacterium koreense TaxID=266125 RepID=A0ABV2EKD4_9CAUL
MRLLLALLPLAIASAAAAQDPHAGHQPPANVPAETHAGHVQPAWPSDTPAAPPPELARDHAAERFYSPEEMAAARAQLAREHGGGTAWKVMLDQAEIRPSGGDDDFAWKGEAWYGGDINRLVVKSEGDVAIGGDVHAAELQLLYSRAVSPYFQLQAGLRHDFEPGPTRTYGVVGFEGLAPYWFDVEGAAFLSEKGDVSARLEGSYDLRLTQLLILQSQAELNLAAQDVPELGLGAGFTDAELALRLRYEFRREFAPYVGVSYERRLGETAKFSRAAGEDVEDTRLVVGVRTWF